MSIKDKLFNNGNGTNGSIKKFLISNMVTILFIIICYLGFRFSGLSFNFYLRDITTRVGRNSFLILSLIIPVLAGMGLNFALVIGAMAGQIALLFVTLFELNGVFSFIVAILIATPFAMLFGYLLGALLNKTKGQEMITSLVLALFANGIYQFLLLILVGKVIPWPDPDMLLNRGFGIRNTIGLGDGEGIGIKYSLDNIVSWSVPEALIYFSIIGIGILIGYYLIRKARGIKTYKSQILSLRNLSLVLAGVVAIILGVIIQSSNSIINNIYIPVATYGAFGLLCIFNVFIVKTKLGQDFRAVGMDMHVAGVAGIDVERTRIKAIMFSIVFASWGQIIFLQNLGNLNTYGSHTQVGMFAIAAILIGGASVAKATIGHALLGAVLFHTLFIVSPLAGRNLFGDAQIGEYFRAFVAYGVIAVALVMHALRKRLQAKDLLRIQQLEEVREDATD
ncbi:MAG: ABC transporter permease subunit [Clostridia bacterium]